MESVAIPLDLARLTPPAPENPETTIAAGLRRDDPGAIDSLWREYGHTVFGFLVRTLGDRAEAEDVHQQVFTEAWQRRRDFDPRRGRLLTWLMTIARSRAIDNRRRRRPEPTDPALVDASPGDLHDPEEEMLERWRVAQLLRQIPTAEAELLRLRFYEELSQREIAARSGIPLGTVKMRMVQALERLRELIEDEEGG
ncbi:MAG: sigma-70 family RNA polymerase sigma factor [Actinomycetota bacterium]|nr:sigma-70 family RNA polymerase sigma factor [Actinomycetota bacterium]